MLQSLRESIDIIILTEGHLNENNPILDIPNYECVTAQGRRTKNEGVLIYYKTPMQAAAVTTEIIKECTSILITFQTNNNINNNNNQLTILGIYRTPSISDVEPFVSSLEITLDKYKAKNPIIIGDVNINIKNHNSNRSTRYLDMLATRGYISCINDYTRVTNETESCIDHIFIPEELFCEQITALNILTKVTDHYTQIINIPSQTPEKSDPSNFVNN